MAQIEQGGLNLTSATVISVNLNPYSILGNGVKTVAIAGTPVQLASSNAIKTLTIRSFSTNTGLIYIGSSTMTTATGFQLSPQETVSIDIANLSSVWIDAAISGEGVSYIYLS